MKSLTIWAAKNRKKAIFVMVILHIFLAVNGIIAGKMLVKKGIVLNDWFLYISVLLFLVAFFFYPVKAAKNSLFKYDYNSTLFKYSFIKHKLLDVLSAVSAFLIILYAANLHFSDKDLSIWFLNKVKASDYQSQKQKVVSSDKPNTVEFEHVKQINQRNKQFRLKSLFKQKAKAKSAEIFKKNSSESDYFALKFALIILLSLAATFGLAIFACAVICNGFEVLGVLIFAGGLTGLIFLSVFFIKKLFRKREMKINLKKNEKQ